MDRWRWAQVEARLPSMLSGLALMVAGVPEEQRKIAEQAYERGPGCGAFMQPIMQLLKPQAQRSAAWTGQHASALLSAIADRQWTQARHYRAGHCVEGPNCLLCVRAGRCTQESRDPRFTGTLTHRLFVCPSLEPEREKHMPAWLRDIVRTHMRPDYTLPSELVVFLTRGLVGHPRAWLPRPAEAGTFHWQVQPADGYVTGKLYVDGSQRDAEARFYGCCARRGWAFTAVDQGKVVASAHGLPPAWIKSIPGTETWALLQAVQVSMPGNLFRTDCQAVLKSSRKSLRELTAASQQLARAWAPIALYLEDAAADAVVWMPAHTSAEQIGVARLNDGRRLSEEDRDQNAEADRLAKLAVEEDRVSAATRKLLLAHAARVADVARWIGIATLAANQFDVWEARYGNLVKIRLRDAQATPIRRRPRKCRQLAYGQHRSENTAGRLLEGSRMAALRSRVLAKEHLQFCGSSSAPVLPASAIASVVAEVVPAAAGRAKRRSKKTKRHPAHASAYEHAASSVASLPAPDGGLPHHGARSRCSSALPRSSASVAVEPSAAQELMELEQCGFHVVWPRQACAKASAPAAPCEASPPHRTASHSAGPEMAPDVAEAMRELAEMEACGLRVAWPG